MALANASLLENALMSGKRILAADGENRVSTLTTHLGNSMSARVGNLRRLVNGNIGQLQGNTSELEAPLQIGTNDTFTPSSTLPLPSELPSPVVGGGMPIQPMSLL